MQTINEELRSANEELQSTNQELQSTNEELATSREELQSTNEELVTVNSELQDKIEALLQANSDINNLLASTDIGTIFLDNDLKIKRFTPAMSNFFNLIQTDIDRPISDITSKIPLVNISQEVRTVLKDLQKREFEMQTENGNWYSMRILPYRTIENTIDGVVITFMDISGRKKAEQLGESARIYAESIVETVREPLIILDEHLKVVSANLLSIRHSKPLRKRLKICLSTIWGAANGIYQKFVHSWRRLFPRVIRSMTSKSVTFFQTSGRRRCS